MTTFHIHTAVIAALVALFGCDAASKGAQDEDEAAKVAAKDPEPTCKEAVEHVRTILGGETDAKGVEKAVVQCEKESTPAQRACLIEADTKEALGACMAPDKDAKSAKPAPRVVASGPSGNAWKATDFNPNGPERGKLMTKACNQVITGIDACRKRSEARLGSLNHELVLSRRAVYMKLQALEKGDMTAALGTCADYVTRLKANDDCEASARDLGASLGKDGG